MPYDQMKQAAQATSFIFTVETMVAVVNNRKNCKHILGVVDKWRSKIFSLCLRSGSCKYYIGGYPMENGCRMIGVWTEKRRTGRQVVVIITRMELTT